MTADDATIGDSCADDVTSGSGDGMIVRPGGDMLPNVGKGAGPGPGES